MKNVLWVMATLISVASADQLVKLNVTGMTCTACAKNVKESLNGVKGVKESAVYPKDGRVEVKAAEGTKAEELCAVVKEAGYGCKEAK